MPRPCATHIIAHLVLANELEEVQCQQSAASSHMMEALLTEQSTANNLGEGKGLSEWETILRDDWT